MHYNLCITKYMHMYSDFIISSYAAEVRTVANFQVCTTSKFQILFFPLFRYIIILVVEG